MPFMPGDVEHVYEKCRCGHHKESHDRGFNRKLCMWCSCDNRGGLIGYHLDYP